MQIPQETYDKIEQAVDGTLQGLEQQKKADKRRSRILSASIIAICSLLLILVGSISQDNLLAFILFIVLGFFMLNTLIFSFSKKRHIKTYKSQIVPTLVDAVFPGATYSTQGSVSKEELKRTGLYTLKRGHKFVSEDTITGRIDKTDFKFCEIRITHEESDSESDTRTVNDFTGFAFIADFNKHFQGRTLLSSHKSHLDTGDFTGIERCILEDVDFENRYTTYTTDDQQARYIITPGLQNRILDLDEFFGHQELAISFHDDLMFMIVASGTNHFEASYDFNGVKRDLFALSMLIDIVDQMNLNLRIWSKQ